MDVVIMQSTIEDSKIYRYGRDVTWSLPLLFQYEPVWGVIYREFRAYGIDLPQVNLFGSPTIAWTGGRAPAVRRQLDAKVIETAFEYLKECNAVPSLTFTYTDINEEILKDKYANLFLDIALEAGAHFIVYSDLLKNYIKEKDSNAYVVASVIKPIMEFQGPEKSREYVIEKETQYYNKLLKEYDMVVVRPEYSKNVLADNPNLIDDISRIEVLINQRCPMDCPRAPRHYKFLDTFRLGLSSEKKFECLLGSISKNDTINNSTVHDEELIQKLVDIGIKHLKIQGRSNDYSYRLMTLLLFYHLFKFSCVSYFITELIACADVIETESDVLAKAFGYIK